MHVPPLVSVIIPTYNRQERLFQALQSVLDQTYLHLEVIVVDDGSTDATPEYLQSFEAAYTGTRKMLFIRQENGGAPFARNNGLKHANGEYVVFFDSDDIMLPDRITLQINALEHSKADACVCGFYFNEIGGRTYLPPLLNGNALELNITRSLWGSTQAWMYKRKLVNEIAGYDEKLICKQDLDLTFRYLQRFPKVVSIPVPLSIFVAHSGRERIMIASRTRKSLTSLLDFNFKIIHHCIEHNARSLYFTSIKHLAQDLSMISRVSDLFDRRFLRTIQSYVTHHRFELLTYLYGVLIFKLLKKNYRSLFRAKR